jgi:hypothetical protein
MQNFVSKLLNDKIVEAKEVLNQRIQGLVNEKLNQIKMRLAAEMYGEDVEFEEVNEGNIQRMGRTKLIRVRFRGGKVQRRVKKSAVPGFTIRGGRLVRMSPQERRRRKMAARRSKFKRRSKLRQALRKRQISIRKRKAMGL